MKFLRNLAISLSVICMTTITITLGSMEGTYYYQRHQLEPMKQLSAINYPIQLQEVMWVASSETGKIELDQLSMTSYVYRTLKGFSSPIKDPELKLQGSFIAGNLAEILLNANQQSTPAEGGRLAQLGAMTVWATKNYTATEAMDALIDQIYLGHQTYGADNAAKLYFGKAVDSLGLSENLVLGALSRMPSFCGNETKLTVQAGALLEQLKMNFPDSYQGLEFVVPKYSEEAKANCKEVAT